MPPFLTRELRAARGALLPARALLSRRKRRRHQARAGADRRDHLAARGQRVRSEKGRSPQHATGGGLQVARLRRRLREGLPAVPVLDPAGRHGPAHPAHRDRTHVRVEPREHTRGLPLPRGRCALQSRLRVPEPRRAGGQRRGRRALPRHRNRGIRALAERALGRGALHRRGRRGRLLQPMAGAEELRRGRALQDAGRPLRARPPVRGARPQVPPRVLRDDRVLTMTRSSRWALAILATLLVMIALAGGAIYWLVRTPGGAELVVSRAAGLIGKGTKFEGVEGSLGGVLRVRSIVIDRPDLYVRVEGLEMDSSAPFGGTLVVHRLAARSVEVRTASSKEAAKLPVSFTPPYPVRLGDGRVGTLRLGTIPPAPDQDLVLNDIVLRGEGDKVRWKIDEASVASAYGAARIAGTIGNASPFAVDLGGELAGKVEGRDYRMTARFGGTLKAIEANVSGLVAGMRASARA